MLRLVGAAGVAIPAVVRARAQLVGKAAAPEPVDQEGLRPGIQGVRLPLRQGPPEEGPGLDAAAARRRAAGGEGGGPQQEEAAAAEAAQAGVGHPQPPRGRRLRQAAQQGRLGLVQQLVRLAQHRLAHLRSQAAHQTARNTHKEPVGKRLVRPAAGLLVVQHPTQTQGQLVPHQGGRRGEPRDGRRAQHDPGDAEQRQVQPRELPGVRDADVCVRPLPPAGRHLLPQPATTRRAALLQAVLQEPHPVPLRRLHGLPRGLAGAHRVSGLSPPLGRLLAGAWDHVLLRHFLRHPLLRGPRQVQHVCKAADAAAGAAQLLLGLLAPGDLQQLPLHGHALRQVALLHLLPHPAARDQRQAVLEAPHPPPARPTNRKTDRNG